MGCGTGRRELARVPAVVAEPPAGHFYHGVFPGGESGMGSDITPADVAVYERAVGKRPTWVYFCDNWYEGRDFPWRNASWIRDGGSIPYIRLMLLSHNPIPTPDPVFNLANINRGMFDADFHRWMRGAKSFGSPLIAEYGVEANGFWFPWTLEQGRGHVRGGGGELRRGVPAHNPDRAGRGSAEYPVGVSHRPLG